MPRVRILLVVSSAHRPVFAHRDARHICLREYGDAPEVMIYGAEGLQFPYIPSHLHHIMFELTKNSLRAVADRFEFADATAPPIRVVISQGEEDITIKARPRLRSVLICVNYTRQRMHLQRIC